MPPFARSSQQTRWPGGASAATSSLTDLSLTVGFALPSRHAEVPPPSSWRRTRKEPACDGRRSRGAAFSTRPARRTQPAPSRLRERVRTRSASATLGELVSSDPPTSPRTVVSPASRSRGTDRGRHHQEPGSARRRDPELSRAPGLVATAVEAVNTALKTTPVAAGAYRPAKSPLPAPRRSRTIKAGSPVLLVPAPGASTSSVLRRACLR